MTRLVVLGRSMFVQIALLFAVFVGGGIYMLVVRPVMEIIPNEAPPATLATAETLQSTIRAFASAQRENGGGSASLARDPVIRAVEARNPDFRYFVRVGDRRWGTAPARFYTRLGLDRLERVQREVAALGVCSSASKPITQFGPGTYVDFSMCDQLVYFEYAGLLHPSIVPAASPYEGLLRRWFLAFGNGFLLPAGGVFGIFVLILAWHMIAIRRVARLARSIDPQHLDRTLPERGLATEIVPLVRAVNWLIDRVRDDQRRNTLFLSAAAHEMRTPLTVLRTRMEMLEDGAIKDKLIGDVRRLTDLVNQLLALMSIGNRRAATGFADLVACARRAVADLAPLAEERGVTVTLDSAAEAIDLPGDALLIQSAIANLVGNAISFSDAGGTVEVGVAADAVVTVRDHGPGLGDADPAMLFEPFVRLSRSRRGTGIGLAIVKAVAGLHGGEAGAANAPGGGASFHVSFGLAT